MDDLIRRSDVIGLLEDMLLFGEYDIIASAFSKADEKKAYRAINDIPAVNRWIPVEDALPESNGCYLVWRPHFYIDGGRECGEATICYFDGHDTWHDSYGVDFSRVLGKDDITHWMPLPEPPKEDENE